MEDLAGGVDIHLGIGAGAHALTSTEHLKEVELEIADIALVVGHGHSSFVVTRQ